MKRIEVFAYCPRCGKKFTAKTGHLSCGNCGLDYYINPKPCTANILLNENGEVLLVRRAVDPGKGLWDLPGGFLEVNENFEESAKREIKEELGVAIEKLEYFCSVTQPYLFQGISYDTVTVVFIGQIPGSTKLSPEDDVDECEFFKLEDIPLNDFAFEAMNLVFKKLQN